MNASTEARNELTTQLVIVMARSLARVLPNGEQWIQDLANQMRGVAEGAAQRPHVPPSARGAVIEVAEQMAQELLRKEP